LAAEATRALVKETLNWVFSKEALQGNWAPAKLAPLMN
jgi:hypothetical protein